MRWWRKSGQGQNIIYTVDFCTLFLNSIPSGREYILCNTGNSQKYDPDVTLGKLMNKNCRDTNFNEGEYSLGLYIILGGHWDEIT